MNTRINSNQKRINTNKRIICLLVLGYLSLIFVSKINAQSPSRSFTISPPSLKFSLKPGQQTEKIIKIINNSSEAIDFAADVKDFIVTDKTGTPELLPAGTPIENRFAASTWSTVLPDKFTVKAGQKTTTTLYLQVPADARPGGRYVAVTFRPVGGAGPEGTGAAVNTVAGSLVYLTVLGPTKEEARVISFKTPRLSEFGPIKFTTEIKNLGDIHISPRAKIEVKNLLGQKSFSTALGDLNIFPGTSRIYTNLWEEKWLLGRYQADLAGYYGEKNNLPLLATLTFWVIPYKLIAIIVLTATIIAMGFFYFRRKKEEEEEVKE